jgi:hypothetical protein
MTFARPGVPAPTREQLQEELNEVAEELNRVEESLMELGDEEEEDSWSVVGSSGSDGES